MVDKNFFLRRGGQKFFSLATVDKKIFLATVNKIFFLGAMDIFFLCAAGDGVLWDGWEYKPVFVSVVYSWDGKWRF